MSCPAMAPTASALCGEIVFHTQLDRVVPLLYKELLALEGRLLASTLKIKAGLDGVRY